MNQICVVGGAGYVGLVTGVGLAALGHNVTCVDIDRRRVEMLNLGRSPIYEEGLEPLLSELLTAGAIRFETDLAASVGEAEIVFVAVGTPSLADGRADLSQAISVAEDLARSLRGYTVIAVKSTVPVGALTVMDDVLATHLEPGQDYDIVSNPEFLREGRGLQDFFDPDRIIVGSDSGRASQVLRDLYAPLVDRSNEHARRYAGASAAPVPYIETDPASAQTIKYAANAFLATRISFINEVAGLCERLGAEVSDVVYGLGLDPRIGPSYLQPGIGFGGPCLEKDLRALIRLSEEQEYEPVLLNAVLERNHLQVVEVQNKLTRGIGPSLYRRTVAVLGLAFKEGTNDVRNSLSLRLMRGLIDQGATVRGHDPLAVPQAAELFPDATYCEDPYDAMEGADAAVILTAAPEYRLLDLARVSAAMPGGLLMDTRNLLDRAQVQRAGLRHEAIGRAASS